MVVGTTPDRQDFRGVPVKEAVMRGKAQATLVLEQAILAIVEERAPITVRGVCYALRSRPYPGHRGQPYSAISRIMTAMREVGTLDWTTIVDAVERGRPGAIRTLSSRPPCR
jgi:hypothetical protein